MSDARRPDELRPETRLGELNDALTDLLAVLPWLEDGEALAVRLRALMRRTVTAELLQERRLIALAGMQGAGKSTLAKDLYAIPDHWLRGNRGRGERMPVFIMEVPGQQDVQARSLTLSGTSDGRPRRVWATTDEDDFRKALRDDVGDVLALELRVPPALFGDEADGRSGILVLPGYEEHSAGQDQEGAWQELMRQAMVAAQDVVLVMSALGKAAVAGGLDELANRYRPDEPTVVVTHCEAQAEDDGRLSALRATVAANLRIDASNVWCTWRGAGGANETALTQVRGTLRELSCRGSIPRRQREGELLATMTSLGTLLEQVASDVRTARAQFDGEKDPLSARSRLADAHRALREEFSHRLAGMLHQAREVANTEADKAFEREQAGWWNATKRGGRKTALRPVSAHRAMAKIADTSWRHGLDPYDAHLRAVLFDSTHGYLSTFATSGSTDSSLPAPPRGVPEAVEQSLRVLKDLSADTIARSPEKKVTEAIRLLPAVMLWWAALGEIRRDANPAGHASPGLQPSAAPPAAHPHQAFREAMQDATALNHLHVQVAETAHKFLTPAVSAMGAKRAADMAAKAAVKAAAGATAPVASMATGAQAAGSAVMATAAVFVVAAGATAAAFTIHTVTRSLEAKQGLLDGMLPQLHDAEYASGIRAFERLMAQTQEQLMAKLDDALGIGEKSARLDSLTALAGTAQDLQRRLKGALDARVSHLG